jgi:large subunit ribosomal protein L22
MTGPKTNESATMVGERTGTRASARYYRSSAYKAREVLNLIRGLEVRRADEVLQFTDRDVSNIIRKVLASAVANAQHNDEQDPDELYIRACFADEGPTLKRFRPRARGRASRIRKRTSHITIIVDRMTDEMLARREAKDSARQASGGSGRVTGSAAARRARVERSRQAAAGKTSGTAASAKGASTAPADEADETTDVHPLVDLGRDEGSASDESPSSETKAKRTSSETEDTAEAPYGPGSAPANDDGSAPDGFDIKGNADSMLYHVPDSRFYEQTVAEVWFDSAESAEAAGFQLPPSQRDSDEEQLSEVQAEGDEGSASDEEQSSETKAKRTSSETEDTESN